MSNLNIPINPLFVVVVIAIAVFFIAIVINMPQSLADKSNNTSSDKQPQQQQDFIMCVNKSMDKILNGDLNFSDPDPISHCFDQFLKSKINNGNGTNNNGANNGNNLNNNYSYVKETIL